MSKEEKKIYELLKVLNGRQEFIVWRDLVAKPLIEQNENELMGLDPTTGKSRIEGISEANLKAKVMYLNTLKHLFYQIFDQANALIDLEEKETEEEKK